MLLRPLGTGVMPSASVSGDREGVIGDIGLGTGADALLELDEPQPTVVNRHRITEAVSDSFSIGLP